MDRTRLAYRKLGGTDGTGVCMGLAPFNVQVLALSAQAAAWPQLWYAFTEDSGPFVSRSFWRIFVKN